MALINRGPTQGEQEIGRQPAAIDVQFLTRRPAAFLLSIEGGWETAQQLLDCLRKAGLNETATLNIEAAGESTELAITVQIQAAKGDPSVGTVFEKTGKVIKSLEDAGFIKGIELW